MTQVPGVRQMTALLLSSPGLAQAEDYVSHLDPIKHTDCKYGASTNTLSI